jgi:hypothetical protein
MHERQLCFERAPYFVTEPYWRFNQDINHEFPTGRRQIPFLCLKLFYCLLDAIARVLANICPTVQHPVNSGYPESCLKGDFFNQKAVSQSDSPSDRLLMRF